MVDVVITDSNPWADLLGDIGAPEPPISVATQPGWRENMDTRSPDRHDDICLTKAFAAALAGA